MGREEVEAESGFKVICGALEAEPEYECRFVRGLPFEASTTSEATLRSLQY